MNIGEHLPDLSKFKNKKAPNSAFAEQIVHVLKLVGEDTSEFAKWAGKLRKFKDKPGMIYLIRREAEKGDNPGALFNWLVANKYK